MTAANNIIHKSSHNPKNTYLIVVIFTLWFCTYVPTTWKYCTLTRALLVVFMLLRILESCGCPYDRMLVKRISLLRSPFTYFH